jgi:Predicted membrane protein
MNEITTQPNEVKNAKIVYILYLVAIVVGLTSLIGVIMAYINKDDAPDWVKSHYQYQIRTFWIGLLYSLIGVLLLAVFVGILVLLAVLVWYIVRCIKGMNYLEKGQAHPDPITWLF